MSVHLRSTIILWVVLFSVISFFHSYLFHLSFEQNSAFNSFYGGIIIIGLILTFTSIAATFLLFVLQIYFIKKLEPTTRNLILINVITLVFGMLTSFFIKEGTASWSETFIYMGSYLLIFLFVTNYYFMKLKRTEIEDSNLLDQLGE